LIVIANTVAALSTIGVIGIQSGNPPPRGFAVFILIPTVFPQEGLLNKKDHRIEKAGKPGYKCGILISTTRLFASFSIGFHTNQP
jgi:hypothetical protein